MSSRRVTPPSVRIVLHVGLAPTGRGSWKPDFCVRRRTSVSGKFVHAPNIARWGRLALPLGWWRRAAVIFLILGSAKGSTSRVSIRHDSVGWRRTSVARWRSDCHLRFSTRDHASETKQRGWLGASAKSSSSHSAAFSAAISSPTILPLAPSRTTRSASQ